MLGAFMPPFPTVSQTPPGNVVVAKESSEQCDLKTGVALESKLFSPRLELPPFNAYTLCKR